MAEAEAVAEARRGGGGGSPRRLARRGLVLRLIGRPKRDPHPTPGVGSRMAAYTLQYSHDVDFVAFLEALLFPTFSGSMCQSKVLCLLRNVSSFNAFNDIR